MKKIPVSFLALLGVLCAIAACDVSLGGTPDEEACAQAHIKGIDVVPDTARMGIDTVFVTVRYQKFGERNLQFFWNADLIAEDRGKTNLTTVRCFIPNDTTESLPVDIKAVSGRVRIEDPKDTKCLHASKGFTIYLKRN